MISMEIFPAFRYGKYFEHVLRICCKWIADDISFLRQKIAESCELSKVQREK